MAGRSRDEDMEDVAPARQPKIRSTVTQVQRKQKGRGFNEDEPMDVDHRRVPADERASKSGPIKSVEGWVIFVSNVHEEANEEQLSEVFLDFGPIKNLYLNLDRRSGFCKGYALVEYESQKEAQAAIDGMHGQEFLEQPVDVTWCFGGGPIKRRGGRR